MAKHLCWQHRNGVEPGQAPTFDPDCTKCQELLAAGKRDGTEPRPSNTPGHVKLHGPRMSGQVFARRAGQRAAERAAKVERPDARSVR